MILESYAGLFLLLVFVFSSFSVRFVKPEANSLADRCVREVSGSTPELYWSDCIPQWLQDAAADDCNLHCLI
jgi:hypothetical protein